MATYNIIQTLTENKVTLDNLNSYKDSYGIKSIPNFVSMDKVFTFQITLFILMFLFLCLAVGQIFKKKDSFINSSIIIVSIIVSSLLLGLIATTTGLSIPKHSIISLESASETQESGYYMLESIKENENSYTLGLIEEYSLEDGKVIEPLTIELDKNDFDIELVYNAKENNKGEYIKFIEILNK